jgi:hypothetical protein
MFYNCQAYNCNKKYKTEEKFKSHMKNVHAIDISKKINKVEVPYIPKKKLNLSTEESDIKIKKLENQIKQLTEENKTLKDMLKNKNDEDVCNMSDLPELENDLPELVDDLSELEDDMPELVDVMPELEDDIPELEDDIPELEDDMPELEDNMPELEYVDDYVKVSKDPIISDNAIWRKIRIVPFESKFIDNKEQSEDGSIWCKPEKHYILYGKPQKSKSQETKEILKELYGDIIDVILGKISPTEALDHTKLGKKLKEVYGCKFEDYVCGKISPEELKTSANNEILLKELFGDKYEDIISGKITNSEIINKSPYKHLLKILYENWHQDPYEESEEEDDEDIELVVDI